MGRNLYESLGDSLGERWDGRLGKVKVSVRGSVRY